MIKLQFTLLNKCTLKFSAKIIRFARLLIWHKKKLWTRKTSSNLMEINSKNFCHPIIRIVSLFSLLKREVSNAFKVRQFTIRCQKISNWLADKQICIPFLKQSKSHESLSSKASKEWAKAQLQKHLHIIYLIEDCFEMESFILMPNQFLWINFQFDFTRKFIKVKKISKISLLI